MGVLKVPSPLCLLVLMLLLVPGSEAGTCEEASKTYTTSLCKDDPCVEACHKEGFTDGWCHLISSRGVLLDEGIEEGTTTVGDVLEAVGATVYGIGKHTKGIVAGEEELIPVEGGDTAKKEGRDKSE